MSTKPLIQCSLTFKRPWRCTASWEHIQPTVDDEREAFVTRLCQTPAGQLVQCRTSRPVQENSSSAGQVVQCRTTRPVCRRLSCVPHPSIHHVTDNAAGNQENKRNNKHSINQSIKTHLYSAVLRERIST